MSRDAPLPSDLTTLMEMTCARNTAKKY